jgi:hypothetical protein
LGKKFHGYEGYLHVCDGKVLLNLTPVIIIRFIIKELYKKEYFFFLIFLIHLFFAKPRDLG